MTQKPLGLFAITIDHTFFYPEMWDAILEKHPHAFNGVFFFKRLPQKYNWFKYKIQEGTFLGTKNIIKLLYRGFNMQMKHILNYGKPLSVKGLFQKRNIPIYIYSSVNDPAFKEKLGMLHPNLVISIGSHQIIPKTILTIPKHGVLNKHGSLLPKYAGFWPLFWALYHNEEFSGVTFHKMISKPDAGEMIHQKKFKIAPSDTLYDLQRKSLLLAAEMTGDIIEYYCKQGNLPKFYLDTPEKNVTLSEFPQRKHRIYLEKIRKRRLV